MRIKPHITQKRIHRMFIIYVMFIFVWLFDFRSEGAGEGLSIQIFFLLAHFVFLGIFLLLDRFRITSVRGFYALTLAVTLFLFTSIASGLVNNQSPYSIFRNSFSVFVYISATYLTIRMVLIGHPESIRKALLWLCLGFLISPLLIVGFFQGGIDISTIRYEIQGTSSIAALGLIPLTFFFKTTRLPIVTIATAIATIFLTVTRSFLVVVAIQILSFTSLFHRLPKYRTLKYSGLIIFIAVGIFLIFPDSTERWISRLLVSRNFDGIDPTLISRQSEWNYMWQTFASSPENFLFGSGIAAETSWYLSEYLGGSGYSSSIGFGHNQYLSILFVAGLLGGFPLLIVQAWHGWSALLAIARMRKSNETNSDLIFLATWGATIIIGNLALGFLSAPFHSRGFSLWYGIGTGLLLGASQVIRKMRPSSVIKNGIRLR